MLEQLVRTLQVVEDLAQIQCTDQEIDAELSRQGVEIDVYETGWQQWIRRERLRGQAALRRLQFELARAGGAPSQVTIVQWLSRQYLGHTGEGVDQSMRDAIRELQQLPKQDLLRRLRDAAAQIESGTDRRPRIVR